MLQDDDKKRILMVDDDHSVLDGIRRLLHRRKDEWKIEFVTNGSDALSVMRKNKYDIIISDLLMPGMNGVILLEKVKQKYPETIRFMLSGYNDKALIDKAVRVVHQFLAKPCNSQALEKMIEQAFELRKKLRNDKVRSILSNISSLPVMPSSYQQVIELLMEPGVSTRQIGRAISLDLGMSTKILQVVNSAFYGLRNKIVDPVHAAAYLGLKTVEGLLLSDGIFSKMSNEKIISFGVKGLQEHCIRVGALTRKICSSMNMSDEEVDIANMAGIMHDAGKIIMISEFAQQLQEAIKQSRMTQQPLWQVEQDIIGLTHAEMGGCLLELWGLPDVIIECAAYHHTPDEYLKNEFNILTAVYIADTIDHSFCSNFGDGASSDIDIQYLEQIGIADKYQRWKKMEIPIEYGELEYA